MRRVKTVTEQLQGCSTYIPSSTLRGYVDKVRNLPDGERLPSNLSVGFSRHIQVFKTEQESKLADYLKHAAEILV